MKTKVIQHVPSINIKHFAYDSMHDKQSLLSLHMKKVVVTVTDTDTVSSQLLSKTQVTSELSYQKKSCSECQKDVRKHYINMSVCQYVSKGWVKKTQ